jgi:hypothetical protein
MGDAGLTRWFLAPALTGRLALLFVFLAVVIPTAVRAAVSGSVIGCEFTPYLPFVLLVAVAVGWWQAALVSMASVAVFGGLFIGPSHQFLGDSCTRSAAMIFLGSSAIIIAIVASVRRVMLELHNRRPDTPGDGIIFSLDKGQVWASWNGPGWPLRLGPRERVEEMMRDFLAQGELGKRLDEISK